MGVILSPLRTAVLGLKTRDGVSDLHRYTRLGWPFLQVKAHRKGKGDVVVREITEWHPGAVQDAEEIDNFRKSGMIRHA